MYDETVKERRQTDVSINYLKAVEGEIACRSTF